MTKLTYENATILASGHYLCKSLPAGWEDWEDEKKDKFVEENAWQPFEYWDAKELWREISQLSDDFIKVAKQNIKEPSSKCPKCITELEWEHGTDMETETWHCPNCDKLYEVQIELVRDWKTLKERSPYGKNN
jgi:hypothetical protein